MLSGSAFSALVVADADFKGIDLEDMAAHLSSQSAVRGY
jgi:hypothetical protein